MADSVPTCVNVGTKPELDAALKAKAKNAGVCIHVKTNAEAEVLAWQQANHIEPEINGEW